MIKDETLQLDIMKARIEEGTLPAIKSTRGIGKVAPANEVNVGKRGSIIIPKGMVTELGFAENDTFVVRKTKAGIALEKMSDRLAFHFVW